MVSRDSFINHRGFFIIILISFKLLCLLREGLLCLRGGGGGGGRGGLLCLLAWCAYSAYGGWGGVEGTRGRGGGGYSVWATLPTREGVLCLLWWGLGGYSAYWGRGTTLPRGSGGGGGGVLGRRLSPVAVHHLRLPSLSARRRLLPAVAFRPLSPPAVALRPLSPLGFAARRLRRGVCTEYDSGRWAQSLAHSCHPSIWWTCSIVLNCTSSNFLVQSFFFFFSFSFFLFFFSLCCFDCILFFVGATCNGPVTLITPPPPPLFYFYFCKRDIFRPVSDDDEGRKGAEKSRAIDIRFY